jgi:hypothetical protein
MRIVIEPEVSGEARSLFRLLVGEKLVAKGKTAAQIHNLVGDGLEQMIDKSGIGAQLVVFEPRFDASPGR